MRRNSRTSSSSATPRIATAVRHRRFGRALVALLVVVAVTGLVQIGTPNPSARAIGADDTILGTSRVSAAALSAWFHARTRNPYRASVPVEQLAAVYIIEGARAGVRGDLAFVQSVLETGWFTFPTGGYVAPTDNNFAGIGAYGDGSHLLRAPDALTGVRAQMQQLRRYADVWSTQYNIGSTPVLQLWNPASRYDALDRTHGWVRRWQDLSGTWASSPTYGQSIDKLYYDLWVFAGRPGASWSGWKPMGGGLSGGPAVSSWSADRRDVFVLGTDNQLWHEFSNSGGAGWSGWEPVGGSLSGALASDPAAVSWASNRIDIAIVGSDGHLWHRIYEGTQWSAWEDLGGQFSSGPAIATWSAGRLDIFARGTGGELEHIFWAGAWSAWENLGGVLTSDPAAVAWGSNRIDVFVRGSDNQLWHKYFDGTTWSGWEPLGGTLGSGPGVASWGPGRLDIFVTGIGGGLWHKWFDGAAWRGYEPLGGGLNSDPDAVSGSHGIIDVFARGSDNQLWLQGWG